MIPPILLLIGLVALTATVYVWSAAARSRHQCVLSNCAAQWSMKFSPDDRFGLAPHVARRLPEPGPADVVVRNLVYRQAAEGLTYLFTVEYTLGVLRRKRRIVAVGVIGESAANGGYSEVRLAPSRLSVAERYKWLKSELEVGPAPWAT